MHPRGERGVAAEGGYFTMQLQKRFLGEVFGFRSVADHAQAKGIDPSLVLRVELRECLVIAILGARESIVLNWN
jgi:hypothetical protein